MSTELEDQFRKRFNELDNAFGQIPRTMTEYIDYGYSVGDWRGWATSAMHLIGAALGEKSVHAKNFSNSYDKSSGSGHELQDLFHIFRAAKSDFEGGYQFKVELLVSGEIFGDFVGLARLSLSDGYKDVAAVLAAAALEDALKRFARLNDVDVTNSSMQEVINSLKAKGLVSGAQKSLIDAMPKIRNHALHAEWAKITEAEVGSILGFVEQFLLTKFTPQ